MDPGSPRYWIVLERLDGSRLLDQSELPGNPEQMRRWREEKSWTYDRILQYALCKTPYVGIGRLHSVVGKTTTFHETRFESLVRDDLLTRGFWRPSSLADEPSCFEHLPSCRVENAHMRLQHRHAIFIGIEADRVRLAFYFVAWAVLGLAVGVAVGLATKKVTMGAAVGGGVLAFVAVSQAACMFAHG